jgi:hypothetical protein
MLQHGRTPQERQAISSFVDPARRACAATIALLGFIASAAVGTLVTLLNGSESHAAGLAALAQLVGMIVAFVPSLMWVHRVNANAQSFADGLSVTPAWNVGWFFVPVGNLWKPFEGMRESWQASEDPENWPAVPVPGLLRAWWGCWLAGNILSNVGLQLWRAAGPDSTVAVALDIAATAAWIAAATALIVMVRRFTPLQRHAQAARVFA